MQLDAGKQQYVAVFRKQTIYLFQLVGRTEKPCPSFARYKGLRAPQCHCRPCVDRFTENRKSLGEHVVVMPEGWHPDMNHDQVKQLLVEKLLVQKGLIAA